MAPGAGVVVDWDAHDPRVAARYAVDRAAYRLARRLATLDGGAVPARVGLARLAPERYREEATDLGDPASTAVSACYEALSDAEALTLVDWRCTRVEAAEALGQLGRRG